MSISSLPPEIHSSAHQVRYDGSVVAEYEVRIYRGAVGPVVVFEEGSSSPLPLEYISELAVFRFQEQVANSRARYFEHHAMGAQEAWVEVGFQREGFFRIPCQTADVTAALREGADPLVGRVGRPAGSSTYGGGSYPR